MQASDGRDEQTEAVRSLLFRALVQDPVEDAKAGEIMSLHNPSYSLLRPPCLQGTLHPRLEHFRESVHGPRRSRRNLHGRRTS